MRRSRQMKSAVHILIRTKIQSCRERKREREKRGGGTKRVSDRQRKRVSKCGESIIIGIHTQIVQPHRDFEVRFIHQRDDYREQHLWHVTKPESVASRFKMRVPPVLQFYTKKLVEDSICYKLFSRNILFTNIAHCHTHILVRQKFWTILTNNSSDNYKKYFPKANLMRCAL